MRNIKKNEKNKKIFIFLVDVVPRFVYCLFNGNAPPPIGTGRAVRVCGAIVPPLTSEEGRALGKAIGQAIGKELATVGKYKQVYGKGVNVCSSY